MSVRDEAESPGGSGLSPCRDDYDRRAALDAYARTCVLELTDQVSGVDEISARLERDHVLRLLPGCDPALAAAAARLSRHAERGRARLAELGDDS
jgi:hypothetical protein